MDWHLTALADVAATPWGNGGGITRELAVWPRQGDWQWRMSVAEVEASGPFSRFERVQRWFAVLSGAGVRLDIDGQTHRLDVNTEPHQFDGAADTQCTLLAGPTQDFNLMLRRPGARAAERSAQVKEEPAQRAEDTEQSAQLPWLPASEKPDSPRMLRVRTPTSLVVDAPKVIAFWAIKTSATALFDSQSIKIPPETLAWRHFEQSGILTLHSENALWMEIPVCTKKR